MVATTILKFTFMTKSCPLLHYLSTEFDIKAINGVPETDLPSKVTSAKIQHGGRLHFEISQAAINWQLTYLFVKTTFYFLKL